MPTLTNTISATGYDGYQQASNFVTAATTVVIGWVFGFPSGSARWGGLVFDLTEGGVTIPVGSRIISATLTVEVTGTTGGYDFTWYGDAAGEQSVFDNADLPAAITKTTAGCNITSTAVGSDDWDVTDIIAELVAAGIGVTGNTLVRLAGFDNVGSGSSTFVSIADLDHATASPASLAVEYEPPVVPRPVVQLGSDTRRPGCVTFLPHPPDVPTLEPQSRVVPPPHIALGADTRRAGRVQRIAAPTQDIARRYACLMGRYHIRSDAYYEFFRSTSGPPDTSSDTPFATATSLPNTPAVAWADGKWFVSMTHHNGLFRSQPYPVGANGEPYTIIVIEDSGATQALAPPKGPVKWWLERRASGVVRVHAVYDDASASLRADAWSIAYTTNGSTPAEDANDVEVAFAHTTGHERLRYDLPGQPNGTTVKVRLQTLRDDGAAGDVFSDDSTVKSATADAQTDSDSAYLGGGPR